MTTIHLSKHVAAEPERVFAAYADIPNAAKHIEGIIRVEMLTNGPVGVGTRFRETRMMFKKEHNEEMEVTAFSPGRSYSVTCESCGSVTECQFTFSKANGGTQVDMQMTCRPVTLFAKLMYPLGRLMMGSMVKLLEKDLDDVKAVIESGRVPAQDSSAITTDRC